MKGLALREKLRRLVIAPAEALGMIRAGVHGVFLISVLMTSFGEIGYLPITILRPVGSLSLLSWKFYDWLVTPHGMQALKVMLVISLLMSTVGYLTPLTTKTSTLLVILYQGLFRSFGHSNSDEMTGIYFLAILAFTPCSDAFSVDALYRDRKPRESSAYGYPILLMQLVLAWCYFSAGLSKLRISGLAYFGRDNLPIQAIDHSLDNLHDTQFRFAFDLLPFREYLGVAIFAGVAWELLFPIAVFSRRARWWLLGLGIMFHLMTLFTMNIFFSNLMAMYLVFVNWPAVVRWFSRRRPFRAVARWWEGFRRTPEEFPGITVPEAVGAELLLWDGNCGFCASMVNLLRRFARRPFRDRPVQAVGKDLPGDVRQWSDREMFWISANRTVVGGSRALTAVMAGMGHGLLAAVLESAPCRSFTWLGYRLLARNRAKLGNLCSRESP